MEKQGDQTMTPQEVADFLRLSLRTVMEKLRKGELPAVKVGRQWRISRSALESKINKPAKEGDEMEAVIERLREQKAKSVSTDRELGEAEGKRFAKKADYDDLKAAVDLVENLLSFYNEHNYLSYSYLCEKEELEDYFNGLAEKGMRFDADDYEPYPLKENALQWIFGWCDGVRNFWASLPNDIRR